MRQKAAVSIAVELALLRDNLEHDEEFADYYSGPLYDSKYVRSCIEEAEKAYELSDDWLREIVREVLRANGQTIDEDADVAREFKAAKKCLAPYYVWDDCFELVRIAKEMFAAGRLSCEAEHDKAQ